MNTYIVNLNNETAVTVRAERAEIKDDKLCFFFDVFTPVGVGLEVKTPEIVASFSEWDSFYVGRVLPGPFRWMKELDAKGAGLVPLVTGVES